MGRRAELLIIAAAILFAGSPEASAQSKRRIRLPACSSEPGDAMSLSQVIESLYSADLKKCLVEYAAKRGVGFSATPLVMETLRELNAPPELLRLIPSPPPEPKPKTGGALTVQCEPKDCEVLVNNQVSGISEQGKKIIAGLRAGELTIHVKSDGFEDETRKVELKENISRQERFVLRPNVLTRRQAGRELLLRTVAALGGVEGLVAMTEVEGSGSVALTDEWEFSFSQRWTSADLSFKDKRGECRVSLTGGKASSECKGKLKKTAEEANIVRAGELFEKYQLPVRLVKLLSRSVTISRDSAETIETDDGPDLATLVIGADGFPAELMYREKEDAKPVKVGYSKYLSAENHHYPGQIVVGDPAIIYKITSARSQGRIQPAGGRKR